MTGRNEKCPCNSGKKFKHCCLPKEEAERKPNLPKENIEAKFEKIPQGEVTLKQAQEVVNRMQRGMARLDPFIKAERLKKPWWKKLLKI